MKKSPIRCAFFLILFFILALPASAQDALPEHERSNKEFQDLLQNIPPEIATLLPEEFFSADLADVHAGIEKAGAVSTVLSAVGRVCGLSIRDNLSLLAKVCALLLLSAVLRTLVKEKGSGPSRAFGFCSALALSVLLLELQGDRFSHLDAFFNTVCALCSALVPLMGTLYAMGGNVRTAAVNHGVLAGFLSITETLCAGTVIPIAGICLALALMDAITGHTALRSIAGFLKRSYTLMITFLMSILCFVLGTQTTLSKAGDTLALRTARFAAGSFLPMVGGSVSETLRTVASSVSYLRGVAGSGAIWILFFTFLPIFVSILLTRIAFLLSTSVAGMLSCHTEGKLLSELASVYGYFLAILAALFVMLVFSLTLFARTATAG